MLYGKQFQAKKPSLDYLSVSITPKRSRRHPSIVLTDLDFADDIALLSDDIAKVVPAAEAVVSSGSRMYESGTRTEHKEDEIPRIQHR